MIFAWMLVIYNDSGKKNIITWNAHVTISAWMLVIYNDSGKNTFITWTGHVMESGFVLVNYNEMARLIDDMNQAFLKNAGEVPAPGLLLPGRAVMTGLHGSASFVCIDLAQTLLGAAMGIRSLSCLQPFASTALY